MKWPSVLILLTAVQAHALTVESEGCSSNRSIRICPAYLFVARSLQLPPLTVTCSDSSLPGHVLFSVTLMRISALGNESCVLDYSFLEWNTSHHARLEARSRAGTGDTRVRLQTDEGSTRVHWYIQHPTLEEVTSVYQCQVVNVQSSLSKVVAEVNKGAILVMAHPEPITLTVSPDQPSLVPGQEMLLSCRATVALNVSSRSLALRLQFLDKKQQWVSLGRHQHPVSLSEGQDGLFRWALMQSTVHLANLSRHASDQAIIRCLVSSQQKNFTKMIIVNDKAPTKILVSKRRVVRAASSSNLTIYDANDGNATDMTSRDEVTGRDFALLVLICWVDFILIIAVIITSRVFCVSKNEEEGKLKSSQTGQTAAQMLP